MSGNQGQRAARTRDTFFDDKTLSDIKIKIGNLEFFAHKLILVQNSVWFEKALLGEFKESKQDVIELHQEDDPAALVAMLKFCYHGTYSCFSSHSRQAKQHLIMYQLGDLYDISDLREEATSRLITSLGPVDSGYHSLWITDETIRLIQQILGPDADSFADNSIQQAVYKHVIKHVKLVYKNAHFRELLADGSMFNESFARKFADKIGEVLSDPHQLCNCGYPPPSPPAG